MDILTAVQAKNVDLKKVSSTRGGEWAGPCPACGGEDRFRCWPNAGDESKAWFCRHCAPDGGDLIEFFRHFDGLGYKEACAAAGCDAKQYGYSKPVLPSKRRKPEFIPSSHADPAEVWAEKAAAFVDKCHRQLLDNAAALKWLLDNRGINAGTVAKFRLGLNPDAKYFRSRESWGLPTEIKTDTQKPKKLWIPRGLVIPYIVDNRVMRIRIRRTKEDLRSDTDPRYYFVPGSSAAIMVIGRGRSAYMVLETELDGMMVDQEAGDLVGILAMGTATSKPDAAGAENIDVADVLLISLDYDQAGTKGAGWWLDTYGRRSVLWPPPCGKDPGDIHKRVDVRAWVLSGLPPAYRIGSSALHGSTKGEAPKTGNGAEKEAAAVDEAPQAEAGPAIELPPTVRELGGILEKYPIRLIVKTDRIAYETAKNFNNKTVCDRISELLFVDPDCDQYLVGHPDDIIDRRNFYHG